MPAKKASEESRTSKKEYKVSSENIMKTVKKLLHEGNVRRIIIKHKKRTIMEIPLTVGAAVGAVAIIAVPLLAAVGAIAAMVSEVTLIVEKDAPAHKSKRKAPAKKK